MMKYDFTTILDRRGMDALAVDALGVSDWAPDAPKEGFDPIPMWVADMNFLTVPTVCEAIIERAKHPAFGYFDPRAEYYESIIRWQSTRNGVEGLEPRHIGYENGVLGGVVAAMGTFCSRGDSILLNGPVYLGFNSALTNAGYRLVVSPLVQDEEGIWRMDYADMERKLKENHIHAAILCSPHNPTGRVWERWELERAMELYRRYDVYVVSDEIWSDILLDGHKHIPTQSISEDARMRTVAMYAPSKTFNLAGLVGAYHIIYNDRLRDRMEKESSLSHYNNMNLLSMYALIGAYKDEGHQWVDELCQVLSENLDYGYRYITEHFEGVSVARPQGTYMLFLDCARWMEDHNQTLPELLKAGWDVGVAWQDGTDHGGTTHIRLNLALPMERVREAFRRMDEYVFNRPAEAPEADEVAAPAVEMSGGWWTRAAQTRRAPAKPVVKAVQTEDPAEVVEAEEVAETVEIAEAAEVVETEEAVEVAEVAETQEDAEVAEVIERDPSASLCSDEDDSNRV